MSPFVWYPCMKTSLSLTHWKSLIHMLGECIWVQRGWTNLDTQCTSKKVLIIIFQSRQNFTVKLVCSYLYELVQIEWLGCSFVNIWYTLSTSVFEPSALFSGTNEINHKSTFKGCIRRINWAQNFIFWFVGQMGAIQGPGLLRRVKPSGRKKKFHKVSSWKFSSISICFVQDLNQGVTFHLSEIFWPRLVDYSCYPSWVWCSSNHKTHSIWGKLRRRRMRMISTNVTM